MLDPGDPAPSFELPNHRGESIALSDFVGQRVVVYFYPRAGTSGCTTEACDIRDSWEAFREREVAVLGISDDPVDDLAAFADNYDLPFHLLSDSDGSVATAYDSYGEKNMFGRTFDGVFRNTYLIDEEGDVEAVFENVSPEGHAGDLLAALER